MVNNEGLNAFFTELIERGVRECVGVSTDVAGKRVDDNLAFQRLGSTRVLTTILTDLEDVLGVCDKQAY